MPRAVELRPGAFDDIRAFASFIAHQVSPPSAARWRDQIDAVIGRLATDAGQWPEADEAVDLGIDLRCRLSGRGRHVYRILFVFDDQLVTVLRLRHAAQDRLTADDI